MSIFRTFISFLLFLFLNGNMAFSQEKEVLKDTTVVSAQSSKEKNTIFKLQNTEDRKSVV